MWFQILIFFFSNFHGQSKNVQIYAYYIHVSFVSRLQYIIFHHKHQKFIKIQRRFGSSWMINNSTFLLSLTRFDEIYYYYFFIYLSFLYPKIFFFYFQNFYIKNQYFFIYLALKYFHLCKFLFSLIFLFSI